MLRPLSLLAVIALASCGPTLPRSDQDAPNPVAQACARKDPRPEARALCQCLAREAAYASSGERGMVEHMAWMVGQDQAGIDAAWKRHVRARSKPASNAAHRALSGWRNTLQNAQARCKHLSNNPAPFFGHPY